MYNDSIAFPHLHILLRHVGKHLMIGNFSIAFYGICIALGMMLAFLFIMREVKRVGMKQDDFMDMFVAGILFGIIGARIYYVAFSWDMYKDDLLQIFNIRGGGLAIYGGIIGGLITVIICCRIKKLSFFKCADILCFGVLIGQICGRYGNFFNREAFGRYTDSLFAMRLPIDAVNRSCDITTEMMRNAVTVNGIKCIQVHPTFLYESVMNLCIFFFLLWYRKRKKFDGEIFLWYMALYGLGRSFIERLRTDQLIIPGSSVPVSALLGILLFAVCVLYMWFFKYRKMVRSWAEKKKA